MTRFFRRMPLDKPVVRTNYSFQRVARPEAADPRDPHELAWARTMKGDEDADDVTLNGDALGLQLPDPNAEKANAQQGKPLEVLLATKNKRILEELTKFRVCMPFDAALLTYPSDMCCLDPSCRVGDRTSVRAITTRCHRVRT